jgi:hypothetical protein
LQQGARKAGAFADQHECIKRGEAYRQLAYADGAAVEYFDFMVFEHGKALAMPHDILVIIEDGNLHDFFPYRAPLLKQFHFQKRYYCDNKSDVNCTQMGASV